MGLLDDLAGQAASRGQTPDVVGLIMGFLGNQRSGGLAGLVREFSGNGLGEIVSSWVGTGHNMPISPQQITQGFGMDTIKQLAAQSGLSSDQLVGQLSQLLPNVVDKLTPNGRVDQIDIAAQGMDLLKGFFK